MRTTLRVAGMAVAGSFLLIAAVDEQAWRRQIKAALFVPDPLPASSPSA